MIKKLANALYNPTKTMLVTQRFSGAHGPAPTKLKKVEEVAYYISIYLVLILMLKILMGSGSKSKLLSVSHS